MYRGTYQGDTLQAETKEGDYKSTASHRFDDVNMRWDTANYASEKSGSLGKARQKYAE